MRIAIFLSFTVLATAASPTIPKDIPNEITRLDECIQIRFLDRKAFGMSRIAVPSFHGMRVFRPENPAEITVVDQLRQKGFEVAAYLVGREALSPQPFPTPRARLQGPASITLSPTPGCRSKRPSSPMEKPLSRRSDKVPGPT
jgi:hypothetical protein